jgi:hypothetical protein
VECIVENGVREQVRETNARLREILSSAHGALAGREDFSVREIRALAGPLREMGQIVSRAAELRAADAELNGELDTYAQTLAELQTALERVRFMLLARQAHLAATQEHIERVTLWTEALQKTQ